MKKTVCPLCKNSKQKLIFPANIENSYFERSYKISETDYGKHLDIYRCFSCNTVFQDITSVSRLINRYYQSSNDPQYEKERTNRSFAFKRIVKKLKKFKKSGRLLDVGCATGAFMIEARKFGFEVYGTEPSIWAAHIAKENYSLKVRLGNIEKITYSNNSFDIITLIDVVEHFAHPDLVVQRLKKITKKGGLICIVTPNIKSLPARILGENWWHIRPGHFFYFSLSTIAPLLEKAGYEIIAQRDYKWYFSVEYLLERFLKLLRINLDINFKILATITLGINLKDSMEIYAVKK